MPRAAGEKQGFLQSAGIISAAVSLSRFTGLIREMAMARLFGAGALYDAFVLGFRIPNLTRNLFAEGSLSSAFVPTFTQYLSTKGKKEAAELSNVVATTLMVVVSAVCIVGTIFSPQLVRLMAPGFQQVPGKFELSVRLTRIMFPFLVLVALSAQAMGVLNACNRFGIPASASAMFNLGSVACGLGLGFTVGRTLDQGMIVSMAVGVLGGGMAQLLWQMPSVHRAGFSFRPSFDFGHPGLRKILVLMVPAILGSAAMQINVVVNTNLASSIRDAAGHVIDGPVSWLGYAYRFLQLPLGIFGAAIASATLPGISRSAAIGRIDEFRAALAHSLGTAMLLTIPSSVGLAVLGESMIGTVYQGGRFQAFDTHQTAVALTWYSVGLAGYAAIKILAPAFYALNDSQTPMLVSLASIAINLAVALGLMRWTTLGHAGLALSASVVALFGAAALFVILSARVGGLHGRRLAWSAARIMAASAVMGAVCRGSSYGVHWMAGSGRLAQLADVAISVPVGLGIFYVGARLLGVEELEDIRAACYTSFRNAPRPEVGDPPAGN